MLHMLGKIAHIGIRRRQYFCDTVAGRPTRLPTTRPPFTFIKSRRVQTTAFCQSRTRHSVFHRKFFNRPPYFFVCHSKIPPIFNRAATKYVYL